MTQLGYNTINELHNALTFRLTIFLLLDSHYTEGLKFPVALEFLEWHRDCVFER